MLLGHKYVKTTMIYTLVLDRVMNRFGFMRALAQMPIYADRMNDRFLYHSLFSQQMKKMKSEETFPVSQIRNR